jgi:hypothetical protein
VGQPLLSGSLGFPTEHGSRNTDHGSPPHGSLVPLRPTAQSARITPVTGWQHPGKHIRSPGV